MAQRNHICAFFILQSSCYLCTIACSVVFYVLKIFSSSLNKLFLLFLWNFCLALTEKQVHLLWCPTIPTPAFKIITVTCENIRRSLCIGCNTEKFHNCRVTAVCSLCLSCGSWRQTVPGTLRGVFRIGWYSPMALKVFECRYHSEEYIGILTIINPIG